MIPTPNDNEQALKPAQRRAAIAEGDVFADVRARLQAHSAQKSLTPPPSPALP